MRTILLLLIFCTTFIACQDDDNETISFEKGAKKRVKQITGENSVWGKYRLNFTYDKEGNFLKAWRLNAETGDTTGVITVDYDLNYHFLSIIDYVSQLDPARIPEYQQKYPNDWQDSVKSYHSEQLLCSVKLEDYQGFEPSPSLSRFRKGLQRYLCESIPNKANVRRVERPADGCPLHR